MRGLLDALAETLRHGAPPALQQRFLEDDSLLYRGLAEWDLVRVSTSAMDVMNVQSKLDEQLPRGKYSTDTSHTTAADQIAVQAAKGPT